MKIKALLIAALLLAPFTVPVFADTATVVASQPVNDVPPIIASTPEAIAAAKEDTSVTIEWGNMLNYAVKTLSAVLATALLAILTYASTFIPGFAGLAFKVFLSNYAEKLIQNLTDYAVNAVAGATKDKKLTIGVGSEVIAAAIQRALTLQNEDKLLKWVISLLGGPAGIGEKVFRKIDMVEGATEANTLAPAVASAAPVRYPMAK